MRIGAKVMYKEHDSAIQSRDIWYVDRRIGFGFVVITRERIVQKKGVCSTVKEERVASEFDLEVFGK